MNNRFIAFFGVLFLLLFGAQMHAQTQPPSSVQFSGLTTAPHTYGVSQGLWFTATRVSPTQVVIRNDSVWAVGNNYVGVTVAGVERPQIAWSGNGQGAIFAYSVNAADTVIAVSIQYCGTQNIGGPGGTKEVRVSLRNTSGFPVTYKLMQDGAEIGRITLGPGEAIIQTFTVPADSVVSVYAEADGVFRDGPVWVVQDGAVQDLGKQAESTPYDSTQTPKPPPTEVPPPNVPSNNPNNPNNPQGPNSPWTSTPTNTDPANQTDLLTNKTFKEGIAKIEKSTSETTRAVGNTNEKLDEANEHLKKLTGNMPADSADEAAANAAAEGIMAKALAKIATAKTAVTNESNTQWAERVGDGPTMPGSASGVAPSGQSNWPTFNVPLLGTITLSPERIPWIIPVLNAAREIVLWLLVFFFIRTNIARANEYEMQLMTVNPAPLTVALQDVALPLLGQILQWVKSMVTAVAVVVVIISAYGSAVLALNTRLGSIVGVAWDVFVASGNVVGSRLGAAAGSPFWGLALEFFPLDALFQLMLADAILLFSMGKIFLFASFLVRAVRA